MTTPPSPFVDARPKRWPATSGIPDVGVGVISIDFQHDFCSPGGFADALGFPLEEVRPPMAQAARVLAAARRLGWTVVHTKVGHRPDLSDRAPHRLGPPPRPGADGPPPPAVGDVGPLGRYLIRGEPGYELVPEVAERPGEPVIDKTGKGAFYSTELELILRNRGVTHLVLVGITSDVCVQATYREAHDRGFESLWLSDATGSYWPDAHAAALLLAGTQGGILGTVATTDELLEAAGAMDHTPTTEEVTA